MVCVCKLMAHHDDGPSLQANDYSAELHCNMRCMGVVGLVRLRTDPLGWIELNSIGLRCEALRWVTYTGSIALDKKKLLSAA